jgi:cyclophilin family peptidyl-prolyl cis-trans isomerase
MMSKVAAFASVFCLALSSCSDSKTSESPKEPDAAGKQPAPAEPASAKKPDAGKEQAPTPTKNPCVVMDTSLGSITIELFPDKAPITVKNFLHYVDTGFYDGTIFHRVIGNFMIQGGGFAPGMEQKPTGAPIKNEATNGLKNLRGTIAMARTNNPHSATAQFFINVVDNAGLDHPGQSGWGYCVFGKVIHGMDVVDRIRAVETTTKGPFPNVPVQDVIIKSVKRR